MRLVRELLGDLLFLVGALAIVYGVWEIYRPAGILVLGAAALVLGWACGTYRPTRRRAGG